jgi:hypothetical protein
MPDGPLRFDTYQELVFQRDAIRQTVFRAGSMPNARLTMDRFWVPFGGGKPAGERLAEHMAALRGESADTAPSAPLAEIVGLEFAPNRGDTVYLDGGNSAFASTYAWSLLAPAGSTAVLSEPNARLTAFVADVPGVYEVTLTVGDGAAKSVANASVTIPNRAPTAMNDVLDLDLSASTVLQGSVVAGLYQDSDPDGDKLRTTLTVGPSRGTVTLGEDGSFVYSYTGTLPPPPSDTFGYRVADAYGATAQATATILLNGTTVAARPTAVTSFTGVDASTAAGAASVSRVQLAWVASSDDVQVLGYNIYRDGALLGFLPSTAAPGTAVQYVDGAVSPDSTHTYRVTAVDASGQSTLSKPLAVAVDPSLRRNILTGWGATGTDTLWRALGCVGCHRGAAGGLTLFGTADVVISELNEDAGDVAPHRIEYPTPLRSLVLCKPLVKGDPRSCPHEGGSFVVSSDPRLRLLTRWVEQGAPNN